MKRIRICKMMTVVVLLVMATTSCKDGDVTSVTLNRPTLTLAVGETETLIANVQPNNASNKNVSWTSSNSFVASVMPNGLVTALSKGETTIMVSTLDGNKMASCVVTVIEITNLFEITFPTAEFVIDLGDKDAALNGVTAKDNKGRDITNSLKVTNLDYVGNGTITYSAEDSEGNIATKTRNVTIRPNKLFGSYSSTENYTSGMNFNTVTVASSSDNTKLVMNGLTEQNLSAVFEGDGKSTTLTMIPTDFTSGGKEGIFTGYVTYKNIVNTNRYEIYEGRYTIAWNNGKTENYTAIFVK